MGGWIGVKMNHHVRAARDIVRRLWRKPAPTARRVIRLTAWALCAIALLLRGECGNDISAEPEASLSAGGSEYVVQLPSGSSDSPRLMFVQGAGVLDGSEVGDADHVLGASPVPQPTLRPSFTPPPATPVPVRPTPRVNVRITSYRDYIISHGTHDVAITIDDGPSENTPALLRVLSEEDARATFFVLGNRVKIFPDYARQIVEEGHEIANHSWSHFRLEEDDPDSYGVWQFEYAERVIQEYTGISDRLLIRIPYGKIYSSLIRTMGRDGYRFITWSIDTKDWAYHDDGAHTLEMCRNAGPGDIILLHSQATSAETLRTLIRSLKDKGLKCITVSDMLGFNMPVASSEERGSGAEALGNS
jgi:peptidoglycan/xylan/chitin deacetylase (PgdA/CDA1 family)